MATYGPGATAGFVTFTGFTPTLGSGDAATPSPSGGLVQFNGMMQSDYRLSRWLSQGPNRVTRRLLLTLIGAASGSTATETRSDVTASQAMTDPLALGGLRPVETLNLVNRATTATDITNTKAVISRTPIVSYVADASGNGGGGHLGF